MACVSSDDTDDEPEVQQCNKHRSCDDIRTAVVMTFEAFEACDCLLVLHLCLSTACVFSDDTDDEPEVQHAQKR